MWSMADLYLYQGQFRRCAQRRKKGVLDCQGGGLPKEEDSNILRAEGVQAALINVGGKDAGTCSDGYTKPLFIARPAQWPDMANRLGLKSC